MTGIQLGKTGTIPQSPILAEAKPDSLTELFARDPEQYQQQDLDKIISVLREQRERFAKAELEAKTTGGKLKRVAGPKVENLRAPTTAEELGL